MTSCGLREEGVGLRLPPELAEKVHELVEHNGETWPEEVSLIFDEGGRTGTFSLEGKDYPMVLLDFPCVVEMMKSFDRSQYFKVGDVSQIIIVDPEAQEVLYNPVTFELNEGLSPPTYDIRKKRVRQKGFKVMPDPSEVLRVNDKMKVLMGLEYGNDEDEEDYEVIFAPEEQAEQMVGETKIVLPTKRKAEEESMLSGSGSESGDSESSSESSSESESSDEMESDVDVGGMSPGMSLP